MVREKILQGQGKVRKFRLIISLEEIFGVTVISMIFFLNEEGKFVGNLAVSKNEWKGRLYVEARSR